MPGGATQACGNGVTRSGIVFDGRDAVMVK